jgi:tight adherence protein C
MFGDDIDQMIIVIVSSLIAALSFIAVTLPFLNRTEKKARYQSIIQNKRQILFEQTKESLNKKISSDQKNLSARESLSLFFKVQQLFGTMGEKIRDQMLQAGIRDPKAPVYYVVARVILPTILVLFALFIMTQGQKEFTPTQILVAIGAMGLAGFFLPSVLLKNHIQKRQQEINVTFPDALDMMLICVQGGIGLEQTINRIADEVAEHSPTLAEELGILSAEMGMLNDRRAALQDFARRVGSSSARSFVTAMIQAEQYGTSISNAMRVIAEELRDMRMAEAERKAASLPPKLTVPMILFFLPALFIVILTPAFIAAGEAGMK